MAARRPELRPRTVADYEWALSHHLLPHFAAHRLDAITVAEVDRYKTAKLTEGRLGATQINKTLKVLAMILDLAVEYGTLAGANPARGRRRRVKAPKVQRTWVEPEQLLALLEASGNLLGPAVAVLAGAGLRVGEAVALNWSVVNLATGTLRVGEAKTEAGVRDVDLPGGLIEALSEAKARAGSIGPNDPVLTTRTGSRQTVTNVDHRLKTAIAKANVQLEQAGIEPISERVSPHSLRRTYASLRAALRDDPVYIAEQLGHEDPTFTFRVYQKAAKRRERLSPAYLEAFDGALDWAQIGTIGRSGPPSRREDRYGQAEKPLGQAIIDVAGR